MKTLMTAVVAALFTLSAGVAMAADAKKEEPAKPAAAAKPAEKAASKPAAKAEPAKKKEKKGGC